MRGAGQGHSYSRHRSHFGSMYKLGCCGHAGLFDPGSIPLGSWPWGVWFSLIPESLRLLNSALPCFPFTFFNWIFSSFFLILFSLSSMHLFTFNGGWSLQSIGDSFDNVRKKLSWPHLHNFAKKVELLASNLCS